MSWTLDADQIDDLARGAAVLGTGGGGDPYIGALLAKQALRERGPVTVLTVDEVPADAQVAMVAMMGAPTVMVEKVPSLAEVTAPLRAMEEVLGRPVTHVMCAEAGGVNSTIPIAAAAMLGLPLVDADGMGRAFPELQMVLPTLSGIGASPLAIGDDKGNTAVLSTVTNNWAERIARTACVEMGCSVMISLFPMKGDEVASSMVPNTLALCLQIGRAITRARDANVDPVVAATEVLGGREIFTGKVTDVERKTSTGFARGRAQVTGDGDELELNFQNEHLMARRNGEVLVTTPDLILVLEHDSGEPITTEGLRYGQRVRVVAAPSDPRWHDAEALAMVGPRYFGYDVDSTRFDCRVEAMA
ncbi:MAG TPA: DUF917 domain-containing protein [Flexivirga sp.]|uniref:DUF917 domain-containing protein n=1 Tax=Flexivirga sp. TaxID=1962927 RepID=UPI002BAD1A4E|nr:DUF917 domain-containing protein [Flexivirga sp.]HWC23833.1 DUF917 domain-containing protein [Flexivirga sp.]